MPSGFAGYDPQHRVHQGLRDLSPCDDGTLTVVFEDNRTKAYHGRSGYKGRIFTATTRFTKNELDIEPGEVRDDRGNATKTHGWVAIGDAEAWRVHKQPIFCWPAIEGLSNFLKVA